MMIVGTTHLLLCISLCVCAYRKERVHCVYFKQFAGTGGCTSPPRAHSIALCLGRACGLSRLSLSALWDALASRIRQGARAASPSRCRCSGRACLTAASAFFPRSLDRVSEHQKIFGGWRLRPTMRLSTMARRRPTSWRSSSALGALGSVGGCCSLTLTAATCYFYRWSVPLLARFAGAAGGVNRRRVCGCADSHRRTRSQAPEERIAPLIDERRQLLLLLGRFLGIYLPRSSQPLVSVGCLTSR